jgi:lysophospholipase L1-like esterase
VQNAKAVGLSTVGVSAGGTGYVVNEIVTLAGGTANYPGKVRVTSVSGGVVTGVAIEVPGVYTVAPSSPASQASTNGAGTGLTVTLTTNGTTAASQAGTTSNGPTNAAFRFTGIGPADQSGSGYWGNSAATGTHCFYEWCTDAPQFDIKLIGLNSKLDLLVNEGAGWQRVSATLISTDASGQPHLYTVAWGGSNRIRSYKLIGYNMAFGGIIRPTTSTLWAPTEARRPLAWGLGDSYMSGTGSTQSGCFTAFQVMCEALGMDCVSNGVGSQGWLSTGSNLPSTRITNGLVALNRTPQYVFLDMGYNDAGGNMTTLSTNFTDAVNTIRAALPKVKIICIGPHTPVGATANLTTVKTTLSGLCTTLGIDYIDVDNWVSSTNAILYTGGDNVHPNDAGHGYLGGRRAQAVSALI